MVELLVIILYHQYHDNPSRPSHSKHMVYIGVERYETSTMKLVSMLTSGLHIQMDIRECMHMLQLFTVAISKICI